MEELRPRRDKSSGGLKIALRALQREWNKEAALHPAHQRGYVAEYSNRQRRHDGKASRPQWKATRPIDVSTMTTIYGIADPRDHVIRYVGKTSRAVVERLGEHELKPSNKNVGEWLRGLRAQGVSAEVIVLETCPRTHWQDREIYWIAKLRKEHRLLNIAKGGKFYGPPKGDIAHRASMAFHRRAIARSGPVKIFTPEEVAEFARQRT